MSVSYIPSRDGLLTTWSNNFSTLISATPTAYGLVAGDATAYAALNTAYINAYALALNSPTRGPSSIVTKDTAKANVIARARQLADIIQANPAVTDTQKQDLGLTVRKTNRTPTPAPTTSPQLSIIAATPLQHTLRMVDQLTPSARLKPFGAIELALLVYIGTVPPVPGASPTFQQGFTKNPIGVNFSGADVGKTAYYVGNWKTRTGLLGPISNMVSCVIVGPSVS